MRSRDKVQNICKEDEHGISYVVVPKIINTDVGFQLMFGRMPTKEQRNMNPIRNQESFRAVDYFENY
jgi:hypothetical protein